jgi:hypothetical protein
MPNTQFVLVVLRTKQTIDLDPVFLHKIRVQLPHVENKAKVDFILVPFSKEQQLPKLA